MPPVLLLRLAAGASACAFLAGAAAAETTYGFPTGAPAFTFSLSDDMKCTDQADGTLSCDPADGSTTVRGVFKALPNVHSDIDARRGLAQLIRLMGPRFITARIAYPAPFDQDEPGGIHTMNYAVQGQRGTDDSALVIVVFSKNGHYYELMAYGADAAMTAHNFPHHFRETATWAP